MYGKKGLRAALFSLCLIFIVQFLFVGFSYANSNLFYPYVVFPTGSWPEAVAIGDVNNDGKNDVVMTTSFYFDPDNDYKVFVFLQNSYGLLDTPVKYATSGTNSNPPTTVGIGDVNNDGLADVVIGNSGAGIEVFLQNASGGLNTPVVYPTINSDKIKIGDFNNDGLLDVAGIGWGTDSMDVLLQNAGGTLDSPVTYSVTHSGYDDIDVGDINNDGLTDIIVMSGLGSPPFIGVLTQKTDGTFNPAVYHDIDKYAAAWGVHGIAVGDVNGDNLKDVVVSYGGNSPNSEIGVFYQNISGTLDPLINYDSYDIPEPVEIADVNQDGRDDIIVAHSGGGALGVYLQNIDGSLLPEELYAIRGSLDNPQGLAVGDITGDGADDAVIADYNNGLVVLYNHAGPAIPDISVSPMSANFGSVFVGDSSAQTVTVYNRGTGDLIIDSITLTGVNASDFSQTNDCSTVGPGSSCTVNATFTANFEGTKYATLNISSNDSNSPAVGVSFFAYVGKRLFSSYIAFPTGSNPEAVAIGDVNGDGRKDVVLTTSYDDDPENDYKVFVFLQNASGQLASPVKYSTSRTYSNSPVTVAVGDVNNDEKADVVIGNSEADIEVFLQNASGGLNTSVVYPTINSNKIKIGDFNNDGLLDVAGIGWGTNSVDVLLQNAGGTLNSPVTYSVTHGGDDDLDVGDVNNDGLTDIIVMSGQGFAPNVGVLTQKTDGTFNPAVYYDLDGDELTSGVSVGDVSGDGLKDVVVTSGGNRPDSHIGVFLQNGSGTLDPAVTYYSYDWPESVEIADVNQDGRDDIVVVSRCGNLLGLHLQNIDGTLLPEELYEAGYTNNFHGLAVGDINGDGGNDAVIADYNNGLVVLYNNVGPVNLLNPVGKEIIPSGSQYTIRWQAPAEAVRFKIKFSADNGITWRFLAEVGNVRSYDWQVPAPRHNKKKCLIKVTGFDSDGIRIGSSRSYYPFTVEVIRLQSPNGSETLTSGDWYGISWTTNATKKTVRRVELSYTTDNGVTWIPIKTYKGGDTGYHLWTVPAVLTPQTNCRVKVVLKDVNGKILGRDKSDNVFTIQP